MVRLIACSVLLYLLGYLVIRLNCREAPSPNFMFLPKPLCGHSFPERNVVHAYLPMFRIERALTGKRFTRVAPWACDRELASDSWFPYGWELYP